MQSKRHLSVWQRSEQSKPDTQDIVVCGFPKSGNTWVTRLLAQTMNSPVIGFWGEPDNPEEAIEGFEREGRYCFYKAHQPYHELTEGIELSELPFKVVYVVRDVRDVILSSARYFNPLLFYPYLRKIAGFRGTGPLQRILRKRKYAHQIAVFKVIAEGGDLTWLETPWEKHVKGYLDGGAIIVKYEDLLHNPLKEVSRLLTALNLPVDLSVVEKACHEQSFDSKRAALRLSGLHEKADFLKVGRSKQWESDLSETIAADVARQYDTLLTTLEYV